jgi:hypothetical protein
MQQTFRATLAAARAANNSANFGTTDFYRMPNMTNPVELGAMEQFSSSNKVYWSHGRTSLLSQLAGPKAFYQFNGGAIQEVPVAEDPPSGVKKYTSSYVSQASSNADFKKNQQNNQLSSNKELSATDQINAQASFAGGSASTEVSLGPHGKYTGGGMYRSEGMQ